MDRTTNLTERLADFVARETGCVGRAASGSLPQLIAREKDITTKPRTGGARTAG
jgi:hypothetical protein